MYSEEMELDPAADRDPISDPGPREHFVKCRITRNRKGVRGQSSSDYHCTVDICLGDTKNEKLQKFNKTNFVGREMILF